MEHQIELTAGDLWDEVSSRLQGALNEATFESWFGSTEGIALSDDAFTISRPERLRPGVDRGPLPRPDPRRRQGCDRPRAPDPPERARQDAPTSATTAKRSSSRSARAGAGRERLDEPQVHLRPLRDRLVEPLRARRSARGRGGTRAGVQPALHLRRHRPRQDAPAAGGRPVRRRARERTDRALRHERDVHERLHQLAARQADRGLQAALPHLRRPPRRRRPVLRGQGADPGGVLPHLQLALRGRPPDRDLVRPAAEGDRDARGAAALPLRMGPDH